MIDAYKIGVSIALSNGMSQVLAVIQKDVLGLNKAVDLTTGKFNRMKQAAIGLGFVAIGGAFLAGIYKLSEAGEKYVHQLERMKTAGLDFAEQQMAIAAANRVSSQIQSTTPTENLGAILDLRAALNSAGASPQEATAEAVKYLALVEKAQAVMSTTVGGRAASANGGIYEMVKALEDIRATQNPARFERLLSGMVQASEAFNGKVTGRDWYQTLKYTRGAGQFYSDDFIAHYLPTLIQEMKSGSGSGAGGGPGNALASLFQAVVGNVFSRNSRDLGIKLGLINPKLSTVDRHGRIHNAPGAWAGADQAALNPALWAQQYLIPALSKQMGGHMLDTNASGQYIHVKEMATTLAVLFGNRTAQQMVALLMNVRKMEGDKKLTESAMPVGIAYDEVSRRDPALVRSEASAQWDRVITDLGKSITPVVTEGIFKIAEGLSYFAQVIENHPVITKILLAIVAGIGAFLVVAGTIAIGVAAIAAIGSSALAAAAVAALMALGAAVIWIYSMVNWADAAAWARGMVSGFGNWISRVVSAGVDWAAKLWAAARQFGRDAMGWVDEIIASLKADLIHIWTGLTEGLLDFVNKLGAWVASIPGRLENIIKGLVLPGEGAPQGSAPGASPGHASYEGPTLRSAHAIHVQNIVYLDGDQIHASVQQRMARDAQKPSTGRGDVDPRLNLLYTT